MPHGTVQGGAFTVAAVLAAGTCFLLGLLLQRHYNIAAHLGPPDRPWPSLIGPAHKDPPRRRVVVFYHIYVASIWEEIVAEQATRLIFSGVYSEAAAINVGIGAKEQQDVDLASEYIRRYGAKFTVIATEVNGPSYERLTLHNIRNYTQPGDRILYLHSKGISRHISQPNETPNVRMWRWVMEYHLLARWKGCMQLLEDHDAVGTNYWPPGSYVLGDTTIFYTRHFSGNFWWTTYEHWVSLPEQIGDAYLDPEMFLLHKNGTRTANLWMPDPRQSLYIVSHWPAEYVDVEDLQLTMLER